MLVQLDLETGIEPVAGFASIDQLVQPFHHQVFRRVTLERDLLSLEHADFLTIGHDHVEQSDRRGLKQIRKVVSHDTQAQVGCVVECLKTAHGFASPQSAAPRRSRFGGFDARFSSFRAYRIEAVRASGAVRTTIVPVFPEDASMVEIGKPAPDFSLLDQHGKTVTLSKLKGSPVVLYFYPKDDTPGCTTEACSFRDESADFKKKGPLSWASAPTTPILMPNSPRNSSFRSRCSPT